MNKLTSLELAERIYTIFDNNGFFEYIESDKDEEIETLVLILDGNATPADGDIPLIIESLRYECIATAETKKIINILYSIANSQANA